jgi:hypothetical protein
MHVLALCGMRARSSACKEGCPTGADLENGRRSAWAHLVLKDWPRLVGQDRATYRAVIEFVGPPEANASVETHHGESRIH